MDNMRNCSSAEEDEDTEGENTLLWDVGALAQLKTRKRSILIALLAVSVSATLVSSAFPLAYDDIDWIWRNPDYSDKLFVACCCFFLGFLSGCVLSPMVLKYFKRRLVLIFCLGCVAGSLYVASWFEPMLYTPPAAAAVCGLILAPFYIAQNAYVTFLGQRFHTLSGSSHLDVTLSLFNGAYHALFLSSSFWRYLLAYAVLSPSLEINWALSNQTFKCGKFDLKPTNMSSSGPEVVSGIPREHRNTVLVQALLGVYFGLSLLGALVVGVGLHRRDHPLAEVEYARHDCRRLCSNLCNMVTSLLNIRLLLITPLCVLIGVQQAVIYGTFIKMYVDCLLADVWVVWACMCLAGTSALVTLPLAWLARYVGRLKLLVFNALLKTTLCVGLVVWPVTRSAPHNFLIFSVLWGTTDSVWHTQTNVLLGIHFKKNRESVFANYRFWQMLGVLGVFLQQRFCSPEVSVYTLLATLIVAMVCYIAMEIFNKLDEEEKKKAKEGSITLPQLDHATWLPALSPHAQGQREVLSSRLAGTKEDTFLTPAE